MKSKVLTIVLCLLLLPSCSSVDSFFKTETGVIAGEIIEKKVRKSFEEIGVDFDLENQVVEVVFLDSSFVKKFGNKAAKKFTNNGKINIETDDIYFYAHWKDSYKGSDSTMLRVEFYKKR